MATHFEIVDVHVHMSRDTAQEKVVYRKPGWADDWYWASPDKALRYMDFHGITHLVAVNIMDHHRMTERRLAQLAAASPEQIEKTKDELRLDMLQRVKDFNRFMCKAGRANPRILPFVMTDPLLFGEGIIEEVRECISLGAKGLKMHPRICRHYPDHPHMYPVYELCQQTGFPILTDTGNHAPFGEPMHWAPVLRKFPRLRLTVGHLFAEYWDQRIELAKEFKGDNIVFDTSPGFVDERHPPGGPHREMPARHVLRVLRTIGVDRILFGSDAPSNDPMDSARQLASTELTEEEKEKIFSKNAKAFLGLE